MANLTLDDLDLRILNALQADASISNLELSRRVHASAPTCLRRVRALTEAGVIARQIAIIDPSKLGPTLTAVVEVSLDRQTAEDHDAFESYICAEPAVTQCYRVSPGPDFVVIAEVRDMAEYDELARRLFKSSANIRNVRTFFSTRRAKFEANARIPPIRSNTSH
ncbi:Lrp/AsnC family transcriptional regulator [Pandoraea apista]|uniref:AsnC family transcriptional regulator n=1 Tax=Pandoraea apista TaxID=93218 RepID=A0A0G4JMM7_9BURK|nr:Lrp/AsnC family transcriptional regulator [Pandoraea apista]ALS64931.1 AsnC family transcriptional regulator [Pandoraea apista]AVF40205.1 Lrp/AsnC family transcriptional regulator [Pandoraea apista]OXS92882.1 AsnC family transcriptional regulator [Pandoraea apista]RRW98387.1 Lrp/AsnC family transcriptional regulator [Pandoraea apista]RRW99017.1 Lrp/AsnC family transcriptional regulator [Pandoraea apista]